MAQKRFLNWKDAVKTFEIAESNMGKLRPGRYAGFDSIVSAVGPTTGVLVDLVHTVTGFSKTIENGSYTSNNAALIMPTGTLIHEDSPIPSLDFETNVTNPDYRYDYIICEHEYVQSVGGTPATYSVIKGPLLAALPTIPSPDKQILIGVVRIDPFNDTAFSGLTYTKEPVPLLGNETLQEFRDKLGLPTKVYVDAADAALQAAIDAITYPEQLYDNTQNPRFVVETGSTRVRSLWAMLFDEAVTFIKQLNINNGGGSTGRIWGNASNELEIEPTNQTILKNAVKLVDTITLGLTQVTSITSLRWLSSLSPAATTPSATDLPAADFDRILYTLGSGSGTLDTILYLESGIGTGIYNQITRNQGYSGITAIIPAKLKWRLSLQTISGSNDCTINLYKLGVVNV